jgi:CRISP-associated protein Cas1
MGVLYVTEQGTKLQQKENRILITKQGEIMRQIPFWSISQVIVIGNIQITTQLILSMLSQGIDLVYLSKKGEFLERLQSVSSSYNGIRKKQYGVAFNDSLRFYYAKSFVKTKLMNMLAKLKRLNRDYPNLEIGQGAKKLKQSLKLLDNSSSIEMLLGIEGRATRQYFSEIRKTIPENFNFRTRNRRPATDGVNALLNLSNTLLLKQVWAGVESVGLDPYIGFLHGERAGKPALVLDLMEQFRTPCSEAIVWNGIKRRQFQVNDFMKSPDNRILLGETSKKLLYDLFEKRMFQEVYHPHTKRMMSFRECIHYQCRLFATEAIGKEKEYIGFVWGF